MNTTDTGTPVRLADLMSGGDMRERVAAKAMKRAVVRHLDAASPPPRFLSHLRGG